MLKQGSMGRRRRLFALCAPMIAVSLLAAGPASAEITPTRDAPTVAAALADPLGPGGVTSASFPVIPPVPSEGPDVHPAAVSDTPLTGFPTSGPSYTILSSGDAAGAVGEAGTQLSVRNEPEGEDTSGHGASIYDMVQLRVDVSVPAGADCLSFDFRFLSEEYPEFVGNVYNDGFVAELDTSDFQATEGSGIEAPHNFAYDQSGRVVSVNTTGFSAAEAGGTVYDGASPLLRAITPVTAGPHTIYLAVFDQADNTYDSAAFIDGLQARSVPAASCVRGASADLAPPDTVIDSGPAGKTTDSTPTFAFHSTEPGSSFECSIDTGTPAFAPCSGPGGTHTPAPLANDSYTFRVRATDASANTDPTPATRAFTVDALPPPKFGKTVNVHLVKGRVRIKRPGGKKYSVLSDEAQIPVGSTVDTSDGRVSLTSAQSPGGPSQSADFYLGVFKVLQPTSGKPITVVKLVGQPTCEKKHATHRPASASRSKKKDGLWGSGHGNYRSVGRHGAATVTGTIWFTQDRCDGTFFKVKRGVVSVKDFTRHKTVSVGAGSTYLAPAP